MSSVVASSETNHNQSLGFELRDKNPSGLGPEAGVHESGEQRNSETFPSRQGSGSDLGDARSRRASRDSGVHEGETVGQDDKGVDKTTRGVVPGCVPLF